MRKLEKVINNAGRSNCADSANGCKTIEETAPREENHRAVRNRTVTRILWNGSGSAVYPQILYQKDYYKRSCCMHHGTDVEYAMSLLVIINLHNYNCCKEWQR